MLLILFVSSSFLPAKIYRLDSKQQQLRQILNWVFDDTSCAYWDIDTPSSSTVNKLLWITRAPTWVFAAAQTPA